MGSKAKITVSTQLAPAVFIWSKEPVLADRLVSDLKAQARKKDPNTQFTEISALGYEKGKLAAGAAPSLFQEERFLYIPNLEEGSADLITEVVSLVSHPVPGVSLVVRQNKNQINKKITQALKEQNLKPIQIEQIKYPSDKLELVRSDIRAAKRTISADAAQGLVDALGSDLRELCAAVAQLISDTTGPINLSMVERYWGGKKEATGFAVADAAVVGNAAKALSLLRHARATGVEPILVVAALASKLRSLAKIIGNPNASATELGMPAWQINRIRKEVQGWDEDALAQAICAVAQADVGTKGAVKDADYAAEKAVLTICRLHR